MKFKDVTIENHDISTLLMSNLYSNSDVKVYEKNDTTIIFSYNNVASHASISNPNRQVKKSEIYYAIQRIMHSRIIDVKV